MKLTIVNLERNTATGLVITAHWSASMEQDGIVVSEYGSVGLPVKSPSDADFVPFEQLTQEVVIAWVSEIIGEQVESSLKNQLALAKNPKTVDGIPWAA
jgi:hypothetical protein